MWAGPRGGPSPLTYGPSSYTAFSLEMALGQAAADRAWQNTQGASFADLSTDTSRTGSVEVSDLTPSDGAQKGEISCAGGVCRDHVTGDSWPSKLGNAPEHYTYKENGEKYYVLNGEKAYLQTGTVPVPLGVLSAGTLTKVGEMVPGATQAFTRVGRWMSETEFKLMQSTGKVVEGAGGRTYVVNPPNPAAFTGAGRGSNIYAEFNVPTNALRAGSKPEWAVIPGPGVTTSIYGSPPIAPIPATCIICVIVKP